MTGCIVAGTGGKVKFEESIHDLAGLSHAQTMLPGVYHQETEKSRWHTFDPRGRPQTAISASLKVCSKAEVNNAHLENSARPQSSPARMSAKCAISEALEYLSYIYFLKFYYATL